MRRRAGIELRAVGGDQAAGAQRGVAADGDLSGRQLRIALIAVVARQRQDAGAGLDQAAGARQVAAQGQGLAALDRQVALQHGIVGQRQRGVVGQRGAGGGRQRAGAERGVVADLEGAGLQLGAADIGVGAVQHQGARAGLGQRAGRGRAGHHAVDGVDRGRIGHVDATGPLQGPGAARGARRGAGVAQCAAVEDDAVGGVAQLVVGADLQHAAFEAGVADIGVGLGEDQGAGIALGDIDAAAQHGVERGGGVGLDPQGRHAVAAGLRGEAAGAGDDVAVGRELQALELLVGGDRDGAGVALEHAELAAPGLGRQRGGVAPGGTRGGPGAIAALPELDLARARLVQHVDLAGDAGLQAQVRRCAGAQRQAGGVAVAAVGDDAIDAHAEAGRLGNVDLAVEGDIAVHVDQAARVGRAQQCVDAGAAVDRERAEGQAAGVGGADRQAAAIEDRHVAAGRAAAGQRRAGAIDVDVGVGQRAGQVDRAAVDIEGAAVGAGAAQRQGAGAGLGDVAGAGQHAAEEAVAGAAQRDVGVGLQHAVAGQAGDGFGAGQLQRGAAVDAHARGRADGVAARRDQCALRHADAAGQRVAAAQRQAARAGLLQVARARQHIAEGAIGVLVEGQGGVGGGRDVAADAAAVAGQAARVELGVAGIGVGARQGECAAALLDQAAGAADDARQGPVARAGGGQGVVERDVVGQRDAVGGGQVGRPADRQGAAAQCGIAVGGQRAAGQGGAAGVVVGAGQRQGAAAVHDEAVGAADGAAQGDVVGTAHGQVAAVERDVVGQRDGLGAGQRRGARHGQHAAAQGLVRAHAQAALRQRDAALEGVGAAQRQRVGALLDQRSAARDDAAQRHVLAAGNRQRAAVEGHVVGQRHAGQRLQRGGAVDRQGAAAQRGVGADHQGAAVDLGAATECVGAGQRQGASAAGVQAAGAADRAGQGQVVGEIQRQALVQRHVVVQRDGLGRAQRRRAGDRQVAAAQRRAIADPQGAGGQGGAALVSVGAVQRQGRSAALEQRAGAIDGAGQGQVARAVDGQRIVQRHIVGQRDGRAAGGAGQRGRAVDLQRARAQRRAGPHHQAAAVQLRAALVGVGAGQGQAAAGRARDQAASAIDHAGQDGVVRLRQRQVGAAGHRDGVAQRQIDAAIERGIAIDGQRAQAQRLVVAQQQGAAVQLGAGMGVDAVQRERAAARFDQGAGAAEGAVQRQVAAAARGQVGAQRHVVGQGDAAVGQQARCPGDGQQPRAQRGVAADADRARGQGGAAGIAVGAIERQRAVALFGQGAGGAGHDAVERQVVRAQMGQRVAGADEDIVGQRHGGGAVQRARAVDVE
ncbi:uncharacterized protein AruCF_2793 [Achromobacter ruhlandii]|nr:uncharacterized protein AruCF_2793 [Achromobacter ruhlandii]